MSRQILGVLLLTVYAFFFASTNLFYHSHQTANSRIVHSHPAGDKAHSHTAGQINLIQILSTESYDEAETISLNLPDFNSIATIISLSGSENPSSAKGFTFLLRAPPCLFEA